MDVTQLNESIDTKLKTCLDALRSNHIDNNSLISILEEFKKVTQSTQQIEEHRKDYAIIFCELLRCCKFVYKTARDIVVPESIQKDLLLVFDNIKRLYIEADNVLHNGYIRAMWFLNELHSKAAKNKASVINYESLKSNVENLLDILDEIQVIFDFKIQNEYVFPINKLITAVIKEKNEFLTKKTITKDEIKILRLAVRLFKDNNEKNVISNLKVKFNLKFIDYLGLRKKVWDQNI